MGSSWSCRNAPSRSEYLEPRFARDENDAAPSSLDHVRKERPGETHPAHHIGFEETQPVSIGNIRETVSVRRCRYCSRGYRPSRVHLAGGRHLRRFRDRRQCRSLWRRTRSARPAAIRVPDFGVGPPIDDDLRALPRQTERNSKADTRGGARNECSFALEFQIHGAPI